MRGLDVARVLKRKGVATLHHANSVETSCTFLKEGGLASRGYVSDRGLKQTAQYTDNLDQRFGIWHDVFTDSVDLHDRGRMRNKYGPVLFVLPLDMLEDLPEGSEVMVTRKNPTKWQTSEAEGVRYFQSPAELESGFEYGTFDQMVTLRLPNALLAFPDGRAQVILDDPGRALSGGEAAYDHALKRLKLAARNVVVVQFEKRVCRLGCKCVAQYARFREFDTHFQ